MIRRSPKGWRVSEIEPRDRPVLGFGCVHGQTVGCHRSTLSSPALAQRRIQRRWLDPIG